MLNVHVLNELVVFVQMDCSDWLEMFTKTLRQRGIAERTIMAYTHDLRQFADWFCTENGEAFTPSILNGMDLRNYKTWSLDIEHVTASTWNRRRASLQALIAWAYQEELLDYNPLFGIKRMETRINPPRVLDGIECRQLISHLITLSESGKTDSQKRQTLRDAAIVWLMLGAGLRDSEICELALDDLTLDGIHSQVMVAGRQVPLNAETRQALQAWVIVLAANPSKMLFDSRSSQQLTIRSIQRLVKAIGQAIGIEDLTPHLLRQTYFQRLRDNGAPIGEVQRRIGNKSVRSTRAKKPGASN